MFTNPGKQVKIFAMVSFGVECISALVGCILLFVEEEFLYGLLTLIGGIASAYIISLLVYAFGELVENSTTLANRPSAAAPKTVTVPPVQKAPAYGSVKPSNPYIPTNRTNSSPAANTPTEPPKTAKPETASAPPTKATLEEIFEYSLKYSTAQGMRSYLERTKADYPEHAEEIDFVLRASDSTLRNAILEQLEENR